MKDTKKELLALGKALAAEQILRKKIEALRARQPKAGHSWTEYHDNGVVISVSLADLLAVDPEAKTEWHTYPCDDGSVKGYFVYGPVPLGEIRKGFWAWAKHETKAVQISEPTKTAEFHNAKTVAEVREQELFGNAA